VNDEHDASAALIDEADRLEDEWRWDDALLAWDAVRDRGVAEVDERLQGEGEIGRGRVLFSLGRVDDALAANQAATAHFEAAGDPAMAQLGVANTAWQEGMRGEVDAALDTAFGARAAIDALGDDPAAVVPGARVGQVLGRLLFAADRPDEGAAAYLEARGRYADAGDDRRLGRCDAALAVELLATGRLDEAEARAEAAVAAFSVLDGGVDLGRTEVLMGRIRAQDERPAEAVPSFERGAEIFVGLDLPGFAAEAHHLAGVCLALTGEDDDAVDHLEAAIELAERTGNTSGAAASRLELGPALARLGHDEGAVAEIEAGRAGMAEVGDAAGAARASYALGLLHRERGRPDDALSQLNVAAELFDQVEMRGAAAQARLDGGTLRDVMAHQVEPVDTAGVAEARSLMEQAIAGFEAEGDERFVALARRAWGTSTGFAGGEDGLVAIDDAREVLARHEVPWEVAECDAAAARVLGHAGRFEEGAQRAGAAVEGFQEAGDAMATGGAALLLGQLLADGGQLEAAESIFEQTVALGTQVDVPALAGRAHVALGAILAATGRDEEAETHRQAAERLLAQ